MGGSQLGGIKRWEEDRLEGGVRGLGDMQLYKERRKCKDPLVLNKVCE